MDDDTLDPTKPSLEAMTADGNHFSLPWNHTTKALLDGFDSRKLRHDEGPWKLANAFDIADVRLSTIVSQPDGGTVSYRDSMSANSSESTDHLSAEVGMTIGYSWLNVGASVEYDRTVLENRNAVTASRNISCRLGRVILTSTPPLSEDAQTLLLSRDGVDRFRKRYGDYYVCGYEIGANAGALLSAETSSESTTDKLKISVSVTVLFWKAEGEAYSEETSSASSDASFTFCGYCSIDAPDDACVKFLVPSGPDRGMKSSLLRRLEEESRRYLGRVESLDQEIRIKMGEVGLAGGRELPLAACSSICRSRLVVQLLMAPFARLEEYLILQQRSQLLNAPR